LDKGTDKTGDDHDLGNQAEKLAKHSKTAVFVFRSTYNVEEDEDEDLRKGETGSESEFEEEERSGDSPIDVSSVPDGSSRVLNTDINPVLSESTSTDILDGDRRCSKVGSHGEVCKRAQKSSQFRNSPKVERSLKSDANSQAMEAVKQIAAASSWKARSPMGRVNESPKRPMAETSMTAKTAHNQSDAAVVMSMLATSCA